MDNNEGNFYRGTGANSLRRAEDNAAAAKLDDTDDSTAGVQKVESGAEQGYYRADREEQKVRKGKIRGVFKRKGVTGLLIGLIFGGMVVVGGSQAMQPFSLIAQFKETYNSMQVSAATRPMLKFQLQGINGNPKWFGDNEGNLSSMQQNSLAAQEMDYDSNSRTINFKDANGATKIVDAGNIESEIQTDPTFANKYTAGTKGWRGAISNWFNKITDKFISKNLLTRNLFSKFRSDKAEADGDEEAAMIKDMSKKGNADISDKTDSVSHVKKVQIPDGEDENGKPKYKDGGEGNTIRSTGTISQDNLKTEDGVETEVNKIKNRFASESEENGAAMSKMSIGKMAIQAADASCKVANVVNKISLLAMAYEMLQVINLTTGIFEGIDKAKAGNGNDSPINAIGNALNQKRTSNIANVVGVSGTDANITEETTTKTAMEANSIVALYSGQQMNYNDPSIKSFNVTSAIPMVLAGAGLSTKTYKACLNIRTAVAGIGILSVALGGLPRAVETLGQQLVRVGVGAVFSGIVAAMVPIVSKFLARDLISNLGGENLGNALTSGANMYMGNAHRANGGSLATKDAYIQYAAAHEQVIAENARYERATKSPFDATSNYTFMGTLARQMMSFAGSNSLLSTLTSAGSVLSSSIMNLTPAASAYDIAKTLPDEANYEERCPYLASIGAVGDAFCNPYTITDTSTINVEPDTVAEKVDDGENFDAEGNIKKGSKLAKYVTFCNHRNSPFGIPDQEIVSQLNITTGSAFLDTAIGMVPGLNDAKELWNINAEVQNAGFITGQACVAGNELTADDQAAIAEIESQTGVGNQAPEWDEAKWYQRFIEDQSLLETTGVVEKSVVTAYLEEYDKENPVDNSYEGMLARYSGLGKDEVIAYLDFMDYCDYIAKYDPSERYAFGQDQIENPTQLIIEDDNFENNPQVILMDSIAYADVRNRQTIA